MTILDEIKPTRRQRLYDLVRDAGIDVSHWETTKGNSSSAASNPKYCYNWSFVRDDVVVLNLWHQEMEETEGVVRCALNPRETARQDTCVRVARAQQMDLALRQAKMAHLPIRVIINAGARKKASGNTSQVKHRLLDSVEWSVESYDTLTGHCTLARGKPQPVFIDQFTAWAEGFESPKKKTVTTEVTERCSKVRRQVLERANGYCEYCKSPGLNTPTGQIFLETHHVIPLSEGGPDKPDNVVALCPNHHREAHHGATQDSIRQQLLAHLKTIA
ncbi:HNH endonuclease [Halomonas sp. McH1-25]|uniref:HNH endonuclease n=1 Tax=unclassified Halomonas TaxID=2609666 RepID=UPI001EF3D755|nr:MULTISPECIES: HNH endonuclease signature motif containing protein [unclassified Halomonas]MCG7602198.1 HNH endonuclease [Halomonas sp. McH1-25]MCP1344473.1 HNH endonuclease [Halomonas sp. FL8]MCP1362794.1 HNH endonuclease [Halomonas sp. BBD45]MCP1365842.1 HNH endonuclease [Halomonas sp. BBD48]